MNRRSQGDDMGLDEKHLPDAPIPARPRRRHSVPAGWVPVVPAGRVASQGVSKFRVRQLPLPRRRRKTHSPDQPHQNENPRAVFLQAAGVILGLVLFVVAASYYFYRLSPIGTLPRIEPPQPAAVHETSSISTARP